MDGRLGHHGHITLQMPENGLQLANIGQFYSLYSPKYYLGLVSWKSKTNFKIRNSKPQQTILHLRLEKPSEKCLSILEIERRKVPLIALYIFRPLIITPTFRGLSKKTTCLRGLKAANKWRPKLIAAYFWLWDFEASLKTSVDIISASKNLISAWGFHRRRS